MIPLWWEHRDHRCLRGWLVRRHVARIRLAMRAARSHPNP